MCALLPAGRKFCKKTGLKKSDWPGEFGARTAAVFGQKRQKTGREK
jgi:hypothetical protein